MAGSTLRALARLSQRRVLGLAATAVSLLAVTGPLPVAVPGTTAGASAQAAPVTVVSNPVSVATDALGDLFVESPDGTLSVLPQVSGTVFGRAVTAGTLKPLLEGIPTGQMAFDGNGDLFIDSGGTVSVLAAASRTVLGVPVTADQLTEVATGAIGAFAVDAAGDLFITNFVADLGIVSVYPAVTGTMYGVPVTAGTWDQLVTGLQAPTSLAVDKAGNIYIANIGTGGGAVSVLPAATGTVFGTPVTAGELATVENGVGPAEVAVDAEGDLFVAPDSSPVGPTLVVPTSTREMFGQLVTADVPTRVGGVENEPGGLAVSPRGDMFTRDALTDGVTAIPEATGALLGLAATAGALVTVVPGLVDADALATDAAGDLFVADQAAVPEFAGVLALPASSGPLLGRVARAGTPLMLALGFEASALATDGAGNLYLAGRGAGGEEVAVLPAASGTVLGVPVTAGTVAELVGDLNDPVALAVDGAGNVYIGDSGGALSVLPATTGTLLGQPVTAGVLETLATGLVGLTALAVDAHGNVFVDESGTISVVPAASGTILGVAVKVGVPATVATGAGAFIAVDNLGDLFSADGPAGTVSVYPAAAGSFFGTYAASGNWSPVVTGLDGPAQLALGPGGNIYTDNQVSVQEVTAPAAVASTSTALVAAPVPATFGQPLTLTATVQDLSGTAVPAGVVTFYDGTAQLGTGELAGTGRPAGAGVATLVIASLSPGAHTLTAAYAGGAGFSPSTSGPVTVAVNRAPTETSIVSSANPSRAGRPVLFTVRVEPAPGATGSSTAVPTGPVYLRCAGPCLVERSRALFASGEARFLAWLSPGHHRMTAVFGGGTDFAPSRGTLDELVLPRAHRAARERR